MNTRHLLTIALIATIPLFGLGAYGIVKLISTTQKPETEIEQLYKEAKDKGLSYAASILEDGYVSWAEYKEANEKYLECMEKYGIHGEIIGINRIDGWRINIAFDATPTIPEQELNLINNRCGLTYEMYGQVGYQATNSAHMDPELLKATKECISKEISVQYNDKEENVADLITTVGTNNNMVVQKCTNDSHVQLYQGEPSVYTE